VHLSRGVVLELVQTTLSTTVADRLPLGCGQTTERSQLPETRAPAHPPGARALLASPTCKELVTGADVFAQRLDLELGFLQLGFDQIADGDNPEDLALIQHRHVPAAIFGHGG